MLNKFLKIIPITFFVVFFPLISLAQLNINIPYALSNELGVEIIPDYPKPGEAVYINLTLYTADLNSAEISWYKNDKPVLTGVGETKYSFGAGAAGEETKIEVRIKLLNGLSFSKSFSVNPAGVDLVWESNSYVPPFYKGKALHPRQGGLKVVAIPEFMRNGQKVAAEKLVYKWSNGINVYESQSGYGKNVIFLDGSILGKNENIEVVVTDPAGNGGAQNFIDISPTDPEIIFYENNPYYGQIFDLAIKDFDLKTEELQVLSAPFYFSKEENGLLKYNWRLNGQAMPTLSGSRTAIFRKPEDQNGSSIVSLQAENGNRILQQAEGGLKINFEK